MPRKSVTPQVAPQNGLFEQIEFEERAALAGLCPVTIFTDGSCPKNGKEPGNAMMGAGIVARSGSTTREWGFYLGRGTNQVAEIEAVKHALARLKARPRCWVRLYSDSEYCIGVLTKNWFLKKNVELIARARALAAECGRFEMFHCRGHAGIVENERADALALAAVRAQEADEEKCRVAHDRLGAAVAALGQGGLTADEVLDLKRQVIDLAICE